MTDQSVTVLVTLALPTLKQYQHWLAFKAECSRFSGMLAGYRREFCRGQALAASHQDSAHPQDHAFTQGFQAGRVSIPYNIQS